MLPGININILNGQSGRGPVVNDAVCGLIISGIATAGDNALALGVSRQIFSLEDAENAGITEAYDTANSTDAYAQIRDFYAKAGTGKELWIMIVSPTTTAEDICDISNNFAKKLLEDSDGRIRVLGVSRSPDGAYEPTYAEGFDDDSYAAILKAHELCIDFAARHMPLRAVIGCRDFQSVPADLTDLRGGTQNRVQGVLSGLKSGSKQAAVGMVLGKYAAVPVQRSIGRVKDGDLNLANAFLSDGTALSNYSDAELGVMHDKGYVIFRKFRGRTGFYFNADPAATQITDDYYSISRGRIIDKAHRITYDTYVNEINDEILVNTKTGYMSATQIKGYQAKIERAITLGMADNLPFEGDDSPVIVTIDPRQDVLATNRVNIGINLVPFAIAENFDIDLGLINPTTNA